MGITTIFLRKFENHTRLKIFASSGTLVLILVLASMWLFRTETIENAALGKIEYNFYFGRLTLISLDQNRDGSIDAMMKIKSYDNVIGSNDFDVLEYWESSRLNGEFDLHYWTDPSTGEQILERDLEGDGVFEYRVTGSEAKAQLRHNRGSKSLSK